MSLQLGHRESVDINLFTDTPYGHLDFVLTHIWKTSFLMLITSETYFLVWENLIGRDRNNAIKLDVFHTDEFIDQMKLADGIRLASIEEIIAMKLEVIRNEGRKKDFWDIHELLSSYTINDMLKLHEKRYPYGHDRELIVDNFTHFERADDDFDPICLKGKIWEFIKEDIVESIEKFRNGEGQ